MAAFHYDDFGASDDRGVIATALNWGGAILSLVLIAGLATWGWKLWVRDVTGVPVVRALEGPMRVAPEDPGGLASEYQGLTVNRIAEERVDQAPSEQVVLAPAPATLNEEEDLAMSELPAVAPEPEAGLVSGGPAPDGVADATAIEAALSDETDSEPLVTVTEQAPQPVTLSEAQTAEVLAVATETPEPQQSATDLAVAAALADLGLKPEPAVVKVEAAANAPRVTPRPAMRPVRPQPVSYTAPLAIAVDEVDVTEVPAGTRLVQLGAFGSVDLAREGWAEAEAKYGDVFGDKQRVIQAASSGGREFYRLRVMGFNDLPDARRFCAMIVADGTNCIPVIHQ